MHVGLTGEFGAHRVSPRQLLAALQVCGHLIGDVLTCIAVYMVPLVHSVLPGAHGIGNDVLQGRLVCAEGIVTKASVVRPKWVKSVHYCPATGRETTREYRCALQMPQAVSAVDVQVCGWQPAACSLERQPS